MQSVKPSHFGQASSRVGSLRRAGATEVVPETFEASLMLVPHALRIDESHNYREELKSVVLAPGSWAAGRSLAQIRAAGEIVVTSALPEALEHAEAVMLAGKESLFTRRCWQFALGS
jgi:hypothetical protein